MSPYDAAGQPGRRPVVDAVRASGATTLVLDRVAQNDDAIVSQAAELHEAGVRIRTLSLFYDEWLGKLPRCRSWSGCPCCSTSASSTGRATAACGGWSTRQPR